MKSQQNNLIKHKGKTGQIIFIIVAGISRQNSFFSHDPKPDYRKGALRVPYVNEAPREGSEHLMV